MDQQLDQYEKWIKNTLQKVKDNLFVGLAQKDRMILLILSLLLLYVLVEDLYYMIGSLSAGFDSTIDFGMSPNQRIGFQVYSIYALILPVLTLVGLVYLFVSKPKGWIIVLNFFALGMVWTLSEFISMIALQQQAKGRNLEFSPDSYFYPSMTEWILWFVAFLFCFLYLLRKPIKSGFGIARKHLLASLGITAVFLLIESMFSVLSALNG